MQGSVGGIQAVCSKASLHFEVVYKHGICSRSRKKQVLIDKLVWTQKSNWDFTCGFRITLLVNYNQL